MSVLSSFFLKRRRRWVAWQTRRLHVCCLTACAVLSGVHTAAWAVDVNRASATELAALRGLGLKTAKIIVQERERGGPFGSLDEVAERVRGIGTRKALSLQEAGLRAIKPAAAQPAVPDRRSKPPAPLIGKTSPR